MEADFSVELGPEDATLHIPWSDRDGNLHYHNLKFEPAALDRVSEVARFPELRAFLALMNAPESPLESAKCDVWCTTELHPEEEIFGGPWKFAAYVDLLFTNRETRDSFSQHERYLKALAASLRSGPGIAASAEFILRRCFYDQDHQMRDGFYFTAYVFGYGSDESEARENCSAALRTLGQALLRTLPTTAMQDSAL